MTQKKSSQINIALLCSGMVAIGLVGGLLGGCATHPPMAPCDDYDQHCEPKIKINQWTPCAD